MGFFSSIGNFVKDTVGKVVDTGKNLLGGVVDAVTGDPIGALGTAGKVVSGLMGNSGQKDANSANSAFAREQFEWQKQYALNRLQWQVEDAKKAGLHPMVAAGLSPTSFSPVTAQTSPIEYDWVGEAGQSLAYASAKAKDRQQQQQAWQFQQELAQEQITGVRLDNELKVMQILSDLSRLNQTGPSAPSLNPKTLLPGQNDSPQVYNAMDWAKNGDYYVPTLSEAAADRTDDDPWAKRVIQGGTLVEYIDNHPNSRPPVDQLSSADRKRLASGHFHWVVHPFGLRLEVIPGHEKFVQWRNKDGSVGGKLFY